MLYSQQALPTGMNAQELHRPFLFAFNLKEITRSAPIGSNSCTKENSLAVFEIRTLATEINGLRHEPDVARPAPFRFRIAVRVLDDPFVDGASFI